MRSVVFIFFAFVPLIAVSQDTELDSILNSIEIPEEGFRGLPPDPVLPQPYYSEGIDSLYQYFSKYGISLKHLCKTESKLFMKFLVKTDGSISNVSVLKGGCKKCNQRAIRLFRKMPKWVPAIEDGEPVECTMIMPLDINRL